MKSNAGFLRVSTMAQWAALQRHGVASLDTLIAYAFNTMTDTSSMPHLEDSTIPEFAIYMKELKRVCKKDFKGILLDIGAARKSGRFIIGGKTAKQWICENVGELEVLKNFSDSMPDDPTVFRPQPLKAELKTPNVEIFQEAEMEEIGGVSLLSLKERCEEPVKTSIWTQLNMIPAYAETILLRNVKYPPGLGPRCKLTNNLIKEPVVASDGNTYEKAAILHYIKKCKDMDILISSPDTGEPMLDIVFENRVLG